MRLDNPALKRDYACDAGVISIKSRSVHLLLRHDHAAIGKSRAHDTYYYAGR